MGAMVVRQLRLRNATGAQIRTAVFQNQEHVVVPVVALVEGVIHAINAPTAEFVPAETLAFAPGGWNGRPVTYDHPNDGRTQISANDPRTLEANSFGLLFNTRFENDRLLTEAWLDPVRAAKVGKAAEETIERARRGEMIEVSVGALVEAEQAEGTFKGKRYAAVWKAIVPDHLAMLPEGERGACSAEMGCGAPRAARAYLVTAAGLEEQREGNDMSASLRERLLRMINGAFRAETTDRDLRMMLETELRQSVPAYLGLEAVDPDEKFVIYAREGKDGALEFLKRSFKKKADGVTLGEDEIAVEMVTEYQEVGRAASSKPDEKPACGCGGHAPRTAETTNNAEESNMDKTKVINDLIASGRFQEADRAWLTSTPEQALTALASDKKEQPAEKPAEQQPPVTPQTPAGQPVPAEPKPKPQEPAQAQTAEQYIANAPEGVREVLQEGVRAAAAKRSGLISQIRSAAGNPFSEQELQAKTTEELEKLGRFAGVKMDYSGRALAQPAPTEAEEVDAPVGVGPAIRAARGVK